MTSIGFRASPTEVTYAVVEARADGAFAILRTGEVCVPLALEIPRQLQFVRTALLDVMEELGVTRAGLRLAEAIAQRIDSFRLNMEGVVQELLASSSVERFVAGRIVTMAALLGESDRKVVKQLIAGKKPGYVDADWKTLGSKEREAALIAIAAARLGP